MTTTANDMNTNYVDTIDDLQGLGYPDSRKLAQDSKGTLYIAYRKKAEQGGKSRYHIFVARSSDGGQTWQSTPIEQTGGYTQRVPSVSVDSHDRIHVVWYGLDLLNRGQQYQIKYAQSVDGGASWSPWQNIAHVPKYKGQPEWQQHPTIYVDTKDRLYVTWDGLDGEHNMPQAKFIRSINGGKSWSKWTNIQPMEENRSRPTLVVADAALHVFAYGAVDNLQQILWSRSKDGGKSWSVWQPIASSNRDQRHISVAVDSQERLHVVWRQQPKNRDSAVQAHYTCYDGNVWQPPQVISPSLTRNQFFPSITHYHTRDADGQPIDIPYVLWSEIDEASGYPKDAPTAGTIYYASLTEENEWSEPLRLRNSLNDVYPSFMRDFQAHLKPNQPALGLVWLDNTGGEQQIHYGEIAIEQSVYAEEQVELSTEDSQLVEQPIEFVEEPVLDQATATQEVYETIGDEVLLAIFEEAKSPFADAVEIAQEQHEDEPTTLFMEEAERLTDETLLPVILQDTESQPSDDSEGESAIEEFTEVEEHEPPTSVEMIAVQDEPETIEEDEPATLDEGSPVTLQETEPQLSNEIEEDGQESSVSAEMTSTLDEPEIVEDDEPTTPSHEASEPALQEIVNQTVDEAETEIESPIVEEMEATEDLAKPDSPSLNKYRAIAEMQINERSLQSRQVIEESNDGLYAVYSQDFNVRKAPYEHIFSAQSQDQGETWEAATQPIAKVGPYAQTEPTIVQDNEGVLHVAWSGSDTLNRAARQIKYTQSQDQGKTWSPWRNIANVKTDPEAEGRNQQRPSIATSPDNTLYITWDGADLDQPNAAIKLIHSTDQGRTWSQWQNITQPEGVCSQPALFVADDNTLHVAAIQDIDGSMQIIKSEFHDQGQTWADWEVVQSNLSKPEALALDIDEQGQLSLFWQQLDQEQYQACSAIYQEDGWQSQAPIQLAKQIALPIEDDIESEPVFDEPVPDESAPDDAISVDSEIIVAADLSDVETIEEATSDMALLPDEEEMDIWEAAIEEVEAETLLADFGLEGSGETDTDVWESVLAEIETSQADFDLEDFAADYVTLESSEESATETVSEISDESEEVAHGEAQAEIQIEVEEEAIVQENIASDDMDDIFAAVTDFLAEDELPSEVVVASEDSELQEDLPEEGMKQDAAIEAISSPADTENISEIDAQPESDLAQAQQPEEVPTIDTSPLIVQRPELIIQGRRLLAELTWPTEWQPTPPEPLSEPDSHETVAYDSLVSEDVVPIAEIAPDPSYIWPQVSPPPEEEIASSQVTATYEDRGPLFTLDRRVSFWATYFGLNITPLEIISESDEISTFYIVKHIFTTRDGSWEPSDQPGSIPVWASQTYTDPAQWQTLSDSEDSNHYLFGAVVGTHGDFMPTETMQLGADGLPSPQTAFNQTQSSTYLSQSGWHYVPFNVDSRYQPTYQATEQRWCWTPAVTGSAEHVLGGNLPSDYRIAIYVVWQAVSAREMEPSPLLSAYI